ncbi:hypothetical protein M1770_01040 [Spiroplasma citri]|uniref:Uncharacterized protein n=1 Tax=Spiroplasma citri TaxID=2133 RepID=Q14PX2_SPICI|nr:hypothetical protein [Spiroplasma citri]WFG98587.1 hypothetical protein M1770_01040 [Spiroplasma citri]CAK98457.1 hypothetical protein n-terminal truncated [Spiroplasma citri]
MNITELIDALNSHTQTIKWEIDALNSKIRALKKELAELKQQILYKEDFYLLCEEDKLTYDWESLQTDEITIEMHLKYCESNNHRYCLIKDINNLPSKESE